MENSATPHDMADDLEICRQALRGEISISQAAQRIFGNHTNSEDPWAIALPQTDALSDLLAEIEDEIPQGQARKRWNAEALAKRDALLPQIEACYRPKAMEAFQAIIDLWQPEVLRVVMEQMKPGEEEIVETSRDFWDDEAHKEYEQLRRSFVERYERTVAHLSRLWCIPAHEGNWETPYFPDWVQPENAPFAWWHKDGCVAYVAVRQHDREWPLQFIVGKRLYKSS